MFAVDRRTLLGGVGAFGAAALLGGCGREEAVPAATRFFERIGKPIGLQLYALVGQDPVADPAALFAQVAAMGYGEIELPNLLGAEPAAVKQAADAAGLAIASLHVPAVPFSPTDGLTFGSDPDAIAEVANALGASQLVIPFPILPAGFAPGEGEDFPTAMGRAFSEVGEDHWRSMADSFNTYGQQMQERGITLGYHNHNLEFAPLGETTPWDILLANTDPDLVKLQLDLGWVAQAGRDALAELQAVGERVISLHVKDLTLAGGPTFYFGMESTEVGSGILDWTALLPAAEAAGVQHYFVEQEPPFALPRPEAMQKSYDFLSTLEA